MGHDSLVSLARATFFERKAACTRVVSHNALRSAPLHFVSEWVKHLYVHACVEHARAYARALCCAAQALGCMGDCGRTPFSGRGTECGRVSAQRSTRQTLLRYLPQTETLAVVGRWRSCV